MASYYNQVNTVVVHGVKYDRTGKLAIGAYTQLVDWITGTVLGRTSTDANGAWKFEIPRPNLGSSKCIVQFHHSRLLEGLPPNGDWETLDLLAHLPLHPVDLINGLMDSQAESSDTSREFTFASALKASKITVKNIDVVTKTFTLTGVGVHTNPTLDPLQYVALSNLVYTVDGAVHDPQQAISVAPGQVVSLLLTSDQIVGAYKVMLWGVNLNDLGLFVTVVRHVEIHEFSPGRVRMEEGVEISTGGDQGVLIDKSGVFQRSSEGLIVGEWLNTPDADACLVNIGNSGTNEDPEWAFRVKDDGTLLAAGWKAELGRFSADNGGAFLDAVMPAFGLGPVTGFAQGIGYWAGKDNGVYKFRVGDPSSQYLRWTGTQLEYSGVVVAGSQIAGTASDSFTINNDGTNISPQLIFQRPAGNATVTWDGSYVSLDQPLALSGNTVVKNKAGSGWITWATRNVAGAETVYDLSNVGTLVTTGLVTLGVQATGTSHAVRADRTLTFTQESGGNVTISSSGTAQNFTANRTWTFGWAGTVSLARGGTGVDLTSVGATGGVMYKASGTTFGITGVGVAGQALISGAAAAPTWFAPTAARLIFAGVSGALTHTANLVFDDSAKKLTLGTDVDIKADSSTLTLSPAGNIILDPRSSGTKTVKPSVTYSVNLGQIDKKFLSLYAAELQVETLVAVNTMATIGGRVLVPGATSTLVVDITSVATVLVSKYNNLGTITGTEGSILYMEANGKIEFMQVLIHDTPDSGKIYKTVSGGYEYKVARNLDGGGADVWNAGDAICNTGKVGSGFIDIYSISGVKGGSQSGPTIVGNVRNSLTYNDWTEYWAIGNLNGLYNQSNVYGVALGRYSATLDSSYVIMDSTYGLRMFRAGVATSQWAPDGTITIGYNAVDKAHVVVTGTGLSFYDASNKVMTSIASGLLVLGETANGRSRIEINAGAISLIWRNTTGVDTTRIGLNALGVATIAGDGTGITNIDGGNIQAGTIALNKLSFTPIQTSNIVASINASSEGITINTARLNLTGVLLVSGAAADVNAGSTTISGGKITAGTITTTQLNFTAVQTSNVVASINASVEGITINTARLNLTGVLQVGGAATDINAGVTTISGGKITAGSITTTQLSATAIDGKTITGATFQTAATNQRVVIDSTNKMRFYNATGDLVGSIYGGSASSYGRITFDPETVGSDFYFKRGIYFGDNLSTSFISGNALVSGAVPQMALIDVTLTIGNSSAEQEVAAVRGYTLSNSNGTRDVYAIGVSGFVQSGGGVDNSPQIYAVKGRADGISGSMTTDVHAISGNATGGNNAIGVYGTATGGRLGNYAGYFCNGDVYVKNNVLIKGLAYAWPSALPASSRFLQCDTVGNLVWVDINAGGVIDLSSWSGSTSVITLGTITTGVWSGTAILDAKIASAATWNAKQAAYANLTSIGGLANSAGWLKNNGTGTFTYATPTKSDVGLGNVTNFDTTNPANITQSTSYRFTTDTEKSTWNAKQASYTNLNSMGALANAAGWMHNDGSGNFVYSTPTKSEVGLGNVVNLDTSNPPNITQSASYRFSTDTEKATWNAKEPGISAGLNTQYWRGDKSWQTLNQAAVAGLTTTDSPAFAALTLTGALNKVTITTPGTSATLTLIAGSSLITAGAYALTLTSTAATNVTFPAGTKTLVATDVTTLSSLISIGTVTTGTWNASVVGGQWGGTGVNNSGKTITLGGNLTTSGAYALTLTLTALTGVTLPTTGTLSTLAGAETITNKVSYNGLVITANTGVITTGTWNGVSISTTYTDAKIKTVTGTTNRLTVAGTATDPTFDISTAYVGQGTITTVGALASGSIVSGFGVINIGANTITSGLINGQTISNVANFTGSVTAAGNFLPLNSDSYDLGSATKLFRKGYLSEIDAIMFTKQTMTLTGGWLRAGRNEGIFPTAIAAGDLTINFGQTLTVGDYIEIRSSNPLQVEYILVGSLVSGTTYNVTRGLENAGVGKAWVAGQVYFDKGKAGNGWVEINAYDTPRISVFRFNATTYADQTEYFRSGDLNGMPTYAAEAYGVFIGTSTNYLKFDATSATLTLAGNGAGLTAINGGNITTGTVTLSQLSFTPVQTNNVVASINATAEGITINTARLNLTGVLLVSGAAADVNAGATTISGGKITANTITLSQLNFTPVQTNNVVASINATTEGILIAGNRIKIDGNVTFTSGYDPTTKLATDLSNAPSSIKNASITINANGTLTGAGSGQVTTTGIGAETPTGAQTKATAAQTNAVALSLDKATYITSGQTTIDGGKITTDTITAVQIASGTITAAEIAAGTITTALLNFTPVQTNNVVASINATAEGITINTARLNLTGVLLVSGAAADVNAGATTISGGKITANTVTLSQLNFTPVQTNNVLSSINSSAEGITINTAKLNLTGVLLVSGAAGDVNAGATTISGGKITAGSITATQLSATAIDGKTITGSTIQTDTGVAGHYKRVMLDTTNKIKFYNSTNSLVGSVYGGTTLGGTNYEDRMVFDPESGASDFLFKGGIYFPDAINKSLVSNSAVNITDTAPVGYDAAFFYLNMQCDQTQISQVNSAVHGLVNSSGQTGTFILAALNGEAITGGSDGSAYLMGVRGRAAAGASGYTGEVHGVSGNASGGSKAIGIYGTASGGTVSNWAGYFNQGNVYVQNNLYIRGLAYVWPSAFPGVSKFLQCDTAGNLTWQSAGAGSGFDADTVDGYHASSFALLNSSPAFQALTISKNGTDSLITFPAQSNDPGYIKHYESSNTAIMYFNVSDDANDYFYFGWTGNTGAFQLRSDGYVTTGHWAGSSIGTAYTDAKCTATWPNSYSGSEFVQKTSTNRPGVTKLYRKDDDSDYNLQINWQNSGDGSYRWRLTGYLVDAFHAECQVSYADLAGSTTTSSYSTYLWSTSHPGTYYISNYWTGTYWRIQSNHSSGVSVYQSDISTNADQLDGYHASSFALLNNSVSFSALTIDSGASTNYLKLYGSSSGVGNVGIWTKRSGVDQWLVGHHDNSNFTWMAWSGTVDRMSLDQSGNLTCAGNVYSSGTPSDKRLKDNLRPIENALETVTHLNGYRFDWNDLTSEWQLLSKNPERYRHDLGMIAQEVRRYIPEAVFDNANGFLSLRYERLVPVLVEAVKTLAKRVEQLEGERR